MVKSYKEITDFLVGLGTDKVAHTDKSFLAHLIGVYRDLKAWGCDEAVCRAGMFHSIYGTEVFQGFCLPIERRPEIRELVGDRAEYLAYLNSAMNRASFDRALDQPVGPYRIADRFTGTEVELSPGDFEDLCRVHLCDWLEQVPRSKEWSYRREAFRKMAARLEGIAKESHDRVYAMEAAEAPA